MGGKGGEREGGKGGEREGERERGERREGTVVERPHLI